MKVRNVLGNVGMVLAVVLGTSACAGPPPVEGTIESKYIEDFTEHTVILKADDGTIHHFQVDEDQWVTLSAGQRFNSKNIDTASDD